MRRLALLLALLAAPVAAAPARAAETVSAGALRATVETDPWHLSFAQPAAGPVLAESRDTGQGPTGTLGFRTAGRWLRATHAVSTGRDGDALVAQLATTDPLGRRLSVRLAPAGEGALTLSASVTGGAGTAGVEAVGIGFDAPADERFLGFGERSNAVDQRGGEVESYVADGPWRSEDFALAALFIPPWAARNRPDATYFPMPWLLSSRGYGALVDNTETSRFRLASDRPDAWSVEADAARLDLRVLAGPRPAAVVRRLTAHTGRQPPPVAPWVLGPWFQTGHADEEPDELDHVRLLRDGDAPVSAVETHMRYMPCGSDRGREAPERARTRALHAEGLAALTYVREAVCAEYQPLFSEGAARDVYLERADGTPYLFNSFVGGRVAPIGMIDFTDPDAQPFYDGILRRPAGNGYDGWMEDYGEYTPPDSHADNGMDGSRMHNLYPVPYHRAGERFARRQGRPIARFVRSGWTGVHPHAQIVWGGDPTTTFGFDGLSSALTQALTMGLSGISTWGSDIGGFNTFPPRGDRLTVELLHRWIELGAVSGVMRTKAEGIGEPKSARPQIWEPATLPLWRRYAKLRTQLLPYLTAADAAYRRTGLPIMRHLALSHHGDARAAGADDQLMFGPDLLAAPVLAEGARERRLYLPRGTWVDLWRSARFERRGGGLRLGSTRALAGARAHTLPAPLDELPLLARAGTLLPLLAPDVDTLAGYGRGTRGLVRLADRRDRLELLAFPRGRSQAGLFTRERLRSATAPGRWTLRIEGRRTRRWRLQASTAFLRPSGSRSAQRAPFRPCRVELDGRPLPRGAWRHDAARRVLRARFTVRAGRLVASDGCAGRRPAFTG